MLPLINEELTDNRYFYVRDKLIIAPLHGTIWPLLSSFFSFFTVISLV